MHMNPLNSLGFANFPLEILQTEMQQDSRIGEETTVLQPKEQGLRRVFSHDGLQITEEPVANNTKPNEIERISCECCGMAEDCTPTYISRIRENFYGKWLCGLCSEAVQEKKRKYRFFNNEQALEAHMEICKQFNRIARVNPNLSMAGAMKNFARKRSQVKDSSRDADTSKPERTYSCDTWLRIN